MAGAMEHVLSGIRGLDLSRELRRVMPAER